MKKMSVGVLWFGLLFLLGTGLALAMDHEVKVQNKQGLGKYLTDAKGKTLYWFKKDSPGKSACAGPCVEKWPLYYREAVMGAKELKAGDFGTIAREDGKKQTTFRGYPLYYWLNDKQAGDTTGQGVNEVWFVVNPDNFPPK